MAHDLPAHYRDDRMVALVRDPSNLFIYWDLEDGGRANLAARLGQEALERGQWTLRIVNLDTGAVSDIAIHLEARNWYASVMPGCTYEVSIGLVETDGEFHRLLGQGPVRTPPLSYSHLYDKQWMILEEDYLRLLALGWTGFLGSSATSGGWSAETEAPWVTVVQESEPTDGAPTSPGVPQYKGRK